VTQAALDYVGSITIDGDLMEKSHIREYEKVEIADVENGERFSTYVIAGERGSGIICLNGAAARKAAVGDHVIIMSYCQVDPDTEDIEKPVVVLVDEKNSPTKVVRYEKHGRFA
jgi:aspartate 1-decarboxylase